MRALLAGHVPPPSTHVPGYPAALERIVLRALEAEPGKRYQSARDLQLDLEAFARDERLQVSSATLGEWMERTFGPKRELWHMLPRPRAMRPPRQTSCRIGISPRPRRAPWIARCRSTSPPRVVRAGALGGSARDGRARDCGRELLAGPGAIPPGRGGRGERRPGGAGDRAGERRGRATGRTPPPPAAAPVPAPPPETPTARATGGRGGSGATRFAGTRASRRSPPVPRPKGKTSRPRSRDAKGTSGAASRATATWPAWARFRCVSMWNGTDT